MSIPVCIQMYYWFHRLRAGDSRGYFYLMLRSGQCSYRTTDKHIARSGHPQNSIQSPDRLYKAPKRLYKAPETLYKDKNYQTKP